MVKVNANIDKKRQRIKVVFDYDRDAVVAIKRVPGWRFVPPNKGGPYWLVPLDLTSAQRLRENFGETLELGTELKKWGHKTVKREHKLMDLTQAKDAKLEQLPKVLPDLHKYLRPYQKADAKKLATGNQINALQPGLGKTVECIAGVYEAGLENGRHLVVAPKTSLEVVWLKELDEWLPEDVPVYLISGGDSRRERRETIEEIQELVEADKPFWLVTTKAMIMHKENKAATQKNAEAGIVDGRTGKVVKVTEPVLPELHEIEWTVAIWDEYHKMGLSNPSRDSRGIPTTMLGKAAHTLNVERKWLVSGTPMGGKPVKLWAALHYLDPGRFTSMWRWADEWLRVEDNGYGKSVSGVKSEREDEFWKHVMPYMLRRTRKEVAPELPDKQFVHIDCDMTPKQEEQYKAMAAAAEVKIEEESLTATGILAEYMRLKQFADARQKITKTKVVDQETGDVTERLDLTPTDESGKLPHILELLEERGIVAKRKRGDDSDVEEEGDEQVIIGSQFSQVVDMIHKWLVDQGINAEKLTGGTGGSARADMVRRFQSDDPNRPRVLVMTTTAGGVSITLDNADTCILVDETWDPDDQEQFSDRGFARKVSDPKAKANKMIVYHLRSKATVEHYIWQITEGKQVTNKTILDLRRQGLRAVEGVDV